MVWTQNRIRSRLSIRRQKPTLEQLDERCLLSTGAGTSLTHEAVPHAHVAAIRADVSTKLSLHDHAVSRSTMVKVNTVTTAPPVTTVERPAGTIVTGTPTAYDPIVGAAAARQQYGVDGTGMTVAVIDTGVDYNNPALGGGFGPNAKVIAGYNFATNTADPLATSSQHGTAVAGLIGSSNPNDLGVAPGVKLVALRVTDSNNTASLTSIANALQWVINNHTQYNISVVNMSLSDGGNYAQNWFAQDGGVGQQITNLIGQLGKLNIPVVSATGNSFNGQQGEGFTAVVSGVISVTATNTSGQLLSDAQRLGATVGNGTMTDLAAPGQGMIAPTGDNGYSSVEGTSFATPLVTGAVVLLQQIYQARFGTLPTVSQVTQWLEKGSDPIYDSVTGLTIGRLDIPKAAALIPAATSSSASTTAAPVTVSIPNLHSSTASTSTTSSLSVSYVAATSTPASGATTSSTTTSSSTPSTTTTNSSSSSTTPTTTISSSSKPQATSTAVAHSTPVSTSSGLAPNVQVFVNGQQVNSVDESQSSMLPTLPQNNFNSLVKAMSAWAAGTTRRPELVIEREPGSNLERGILNVTDSTRRCGSCTPVGFAA